PRPGPRAARRPRSSHPRTPRLRGLQETAGPRLPERSPRRDQEARRVGVAPAQADPPATPRPGGHEFLDRTRRRGRRDLGIATLRPHGPTLMLRWSALGRFLVFALAASSIWCLLADFYGLCSMRIFTFFVSLPALAALMMLGLLDLRAGDGRLWRGLVI